MRGAKQKYKELADKKWLEKAIEAKKTAGDISEELGCNYQTVRYAFQKFGLKPCKKIAKYDNVEFGNWKTGKILKTKGASNLKKKLNFDQIEWIHLYPVVRGERLVLGDYCLAEHLKKEYCVVGPDKIPVRFKNWLKFAKDRGLSENLFKSLLDEEILYHNGYYLEKNKNIVPAKMERVATINIDGTLFKIDNLKDAANLFDVTDKTFWNLVTGRTTKTHFGAKLEKVEYVRK